MILFTRVSGDLPKSGYGVARGVFSMKGDPFQEGLLLVEEEPMGTKAALTTGSPASHQPGWALTSRDRAERASRNLMLDARRTYIHAYLARE